MQLYFVVFVLHDPDRVEVHDLFIINACQKRNLYKRAPLFFGSSSSGF